MAGHFSLKAMLIATLLASAVCTGQQNDSKRPTDELARGFIALASENLAKGGDAMRVGMVNSNVCAALANLGDFDKAKRLAAGMTSDRAKSLAYIARREADQGDKKSAATTLRAALAASQADDPSDFETVATAMADLGEFDEAAKVASGMPLSSDRALALAHIAAARARAGNLPAAIDLFREAKKTLTQSAEKYPMFMLRQLVELQTEVGDLAGAKSTAEDLPVKVDVAMSYALIGIAEARKHDMASAKSHLDQADAILAGAGTTVLAAADVSCFIDSGRAILAGKTPAQAVIIGLSDRLKAIETMDPTSESLSESLAALSVDQRLAGDEAAANKTMKLALEKLAVLGNDRGERTHAQWEVAGSAAAAGDVAGALRLVELAMQHSIDPAETGFVAATVAGNLGRHHAAAADFQWIAKLPDPMSRAFAYAAAAKSLAMRASHGVKSGT